MFEEHREDVMNIVIRLDDLADHVKDAARCVKILSPSPIPQELWENVVDTTSVLVDCATTLRESLEKIVVDPVAAMESAKKVEQIESKVDEYYLKTKSLFINYADQLNMGSLIIFDHLVEFIEQAADMCADTADYIVTLASSE